MAPEDDDAPHAGPFCVVWLYSDTPDAFERAARFARRSCGYGLEVVIVLTESGSRLAQTDRMNYLLRMPGIPELVDELVARDVRFELDIGSARRAGVVETLGSSLPELRLADDARLADLTTGARVTARY